MNKNKGYLIIIVVLVLSHIVLLSVHFFKGPPGNNPKKELIHVLDLSNEQIKSYEVLIDSHRKAIKSLNKKTINQRKALYGSLSEEKPNLDALDSLSVLQEEIERVHLAHFQAIRRLCNPKQKKAFDSFSPQLPKLFSKAKRK